MKEKIQIVNVVISVIIIVLAVLQLIGKPLFPSIYLMALVLVNLLITILRNKKPKDQAGAEDSTKEE